MRIVNNAFLDIARSPTESRVTLGTPHLITTIDLEDGNLATRTGFARLKRLSRFDVFGFTLVRRLCVDHHVTIGANIQITDATGVIVLTN